MSSTPGPWSSTDGAGGYRRKPYFVIRGPSPRSRRIARVEADAPDDARLIEAAPELLDALKLAYEQMTGRGAALRQRFAVAHLDQMLAAIKKAESSP